MHAKRILVLGSIVVVLALSAPAAFSAEPTDAKLKTVMVAAFKNGLGFFLRQGKAELSGGATLRLAAGSRLTPQAHDAARRLNLQLVLE